jgi:hypothetical protein
MSGSAVAGSAIAGRVEQSLCTGRFGDSASLRANADTYYAGVTRLLGDLFPGFGVTWPWPADPRRRVLVRGYLDEIMIYLQTGREPEAAVRARELTELLDGDAGTRAGTADRDGDGTGNRSGDGDGDGDRGGDGPAVFTRRPADPIAAALLDRFHATMRNDGHPYRVEPVAPTPAILRVVTEVRTLLEKLVPTLAPSTLRLIDGIVVFEDDPAGGRLESAFVNGNPLVVYLNRTMFDDPLEAADSLLHEALHQKLVEVRLTRRMLRDGYDNSTSHQILVPWGGAGRWFSVDRSLAAFHVYVHLALMHLVALDRRAEVCPYLTAAQLRRRLVSRWARARFFGTELAADPARGDLGVDGRHLVAWLDAATTELGAADSGDGTQLAVHIGAFDG